MRAAGQERVVIQLKGIPAKIIGDVAVRTAIACNPGDADGRRSLSRHNAQRRIDGQGIDRGNEHRRAVTIETESNGVHQGGSEDVRLLKTGEGPRVLVMPENIIESTGTQILADIVLEAARKAIFF